MSNRTMSAVARFLFIASSHSSPAPIFSEVPRTNQTLSLQQGKVRFELLAHLFVFVRIGIEETERLRSG